MKSMVFTLSKRKEEKAVEKKQQNLYRELSSMLTKKILDFRVDVQETSPEEFENLRRCQNYCHLVEKNLMPEFRFSGAASKVGTPRASTARTRRRTMVSSMDLDDCERANFRQHLQRIQRDADTLREELNGCEIRE